MDVEKATNQLRDLQVWHDQIKGLGVVPPDVGELLKVVRDEAHDIAKLKNEKVVLAGEVAALKSNLAKERETASVALKLTLEREEADLGKEVAKLREEKKSLVTEIEAARKQNAEELPRLRDERNELAAQIAKMKDDFKKLELDFNAFRAARGLV